MTKAINDATLNKAGDIYQYLIALTRPRPHRHLKRKDSIRFLVLLVFSNFFIYTGCWKELTPGRRTRVKIYS